MPSAKEIRTQIKSIGNTRKITRAMKMVVVVVWTGVLTAGCTPGLPTVPTIGALNPASVTVQLQTSISKTDAVLAAIQKEAERGCSVNNKEAVFLGKSCALHDGFVCLLSNFVFGCQ